MIEDSEQKGRGLHQKFKDAGLVGCLDGTGITSTNYKDFLMDAWISVKDSLPQSCKKGFQVLILVNSKCFIAYVMGDGEIVSTDGKFVFFNNRWASDARFAEPTHWMHLPKPPEIND